jgi:hypothetical protein
MVLETGKCVRIGKTERGWVQKTSHIIYQWSILIYKHLKLLKLLNYPGSTHLSLKVHIIL